MAKSAKAKNARRPSRAEAIEFYLATHNEDVPPKEMPRRAPAAMAQMGQAKS